MIFLKAPNLLFFKSRKTAGTSIEIALSANATDDDIVTPISIRDEIMRMSRYGVTPRNWAKSKEAESSYLQAFSHILETTEFGSSARKSLIQDIKDNRQSTFKENRLFYNHIPPHIVEEEKNLPDYNTAIKITATRHPYEQLISHAYFKADMNQILACDQHLNDQIEFLLSRPSSNNHYYFNKDGSAICDIYIRYETLKADLKSLEDRFGLTLLDNLPFTKHKKRTDRRPAREILTEDQKQRCFERCKAEFEFFGYEP
ncbi:hypothetical protein ACTL6U_18255 [Rhodovibrionaceae bacterium A322]